MFFESTDSSTGRDGRRALLDLIKGCVSPGTAPFAAALAAGDDVKTEAALKAILDKIQVLEHLIRGGCGAAAELDMSTYGFSVPAESGAGYGTLAARLDDLVSATSVSFDDASFERGVDVNLPPAAAAVAVGVQCEADLDGLAYGYEGSTGGGTYGIATVEPAPRLVERTPWPLSRHRRFQCRRLRGTARDS
ncbi:hypothetical protein CYMTET_56866 [Cymbomonas tetramitiformis]|uniref:Uncharacterized protein n=1 Tax=Cymbomonas tetramitiformis TaxID=36881 RepID=A0AAE0BAH8_9CHLO|nr:hypothetical protein CYMTET_56866 [Cymbomonas tetramitiformis]